MKHIYSQDLNDGYIEENPNFKQFLLSPILRHVTLTQMLQHIIKIDSIFTFLKSPEFHKQHNSSYTM